MIDKDGFASMRDNLSEQLTESQMTLEKTMREIRRDNREWAEGIKRIRSVTNGIVEFEQAQWSREEEIQYTKVVSEDRGI